MIKVPGPSQFRHIVQSCHKERILNNTSCSSVFIIRNKSVNANDDDQYIQRSSVPTLHFQPSLPRLPIPDLPKTCERYLNSQKALLSPEKYAQTMLYAKKFCETEGVNLQNTLKNEDAQNKHTSYISGPWFDMYLSDRKALPINFNPFLVFVNDNRVEYNNQLIRSANLIVSSLRFKKSLDANILEPEVFHLNPKKSDTKWFRTVTGAMPSSLSWYAAYIFKAFPLDMSQYNNLFNTTRLPQLEKDKLYHDGTQKHIVVLKNGNFYSFDVFDKDGNIVDANTIYACLQYISSRNDKAEYPVGILTTANRDKWAIARKHIESIGNEEVFRIIDGSLFIVALDSDSGGTHPDNLVKQFLHSDGTNRWFDKSFSLIIAADGVAGINFEHSWGDGVAVLRYFQDIYNDSTTKPRIHPNTQCTADVKQIVRKLEFKLDDNSKNLIVETRQKYSETCKSLAIQSFEFNAFGRSLCKQHQISPDSIAQLAFQMAYDLLADKQVATYESCSTAAFKHGRTETVRPCTLDTKEFCKAIKSSKNFNNLELKAMISKCSSIHSNLIKDAAMGQGFDRHLFALKRLANLSGMKLDIFLDPAYDLLNYNILSTSTLSSDVVLLGAFGPVVHDGLGIGYSISDNRIGTVVTNYHAHSDGKGFLQCLNISLNKLYDILKQNGKN